MVVRMCRADLSISVCQVKVRSLVSLHQLLLGETAPASPQLPLVHHESALSLNQSSYDLLFSSTSVYVVYKIVQEGRLCIMCADGPGADQ